MIDTERVLNYYRNSSEWDLIEFPVNSEGVEHEFRMSSQLAVRVFCWDNVIPGVREARKHTRATRRTKGKGS